MQQVYYQKVHLLIPDLIKNKFLGGKEEKTSIKSAARGAHGHEFSTHERTGGTVLPSK